MKEEKKAVTKYIYLEQHIRVFCLTPVGTSAGSNFLILETKQKKGARKLISSNLSLSTKQLLLWRSALRFITQ